MRNSGVVRFDDRDGATDVEVALEYEPPAGAAGELAARLFENPDEQVEEALRRFQQVVEREA